MRWILAGLFFLVFVTPSIAQNKGEVESIGFGSYIRPNTWTPMVVRLRPGTLEPGYYQIQIEQKDMDEDTAIFTRTIQVNAADVAREQRFWMYFLPQTVKKGLPDAGDGFTLRDLNSQLKVWLCDENGRQIEPLPLTSTIRSIDKGSTFTNRPLSRKFILCVSDGSSKPLYQEYSDAYGVTEDVAMVVVRPDELPESVLGYDGIDAVVWMTGDSELLSRAGARRLPALTEFVRLGGKLIVTQPPERTKVEALEPLLPIELKDAGGNWLVETRNRATLSPLRDWAKPQSLFKKASENPWLPQPGRPFGPFKVARASVVKPGALVVESIDWNEDSADANAAKDLSPYLVRWGVGLGQVTWVAQHLGDIAVTNTAKVGWAGVWDKVLDLKNDPQIMTKGMPPVERDKIDADYAGGAATDLGWSFYDAMEHSARGAGLVVLAIGFFIIYWAAAGPVSYFVLANKKKRGASWPIFAASALVATLLTVGVVKLVMGASADMHHLTFVRWAPGQPTVVESRLGVYLTESSSIKVDLPAEETDTTFTSYVTAFNPHPAHFESAGGFVGKQSYHVPIPDSTSGEEIAVYVPFRSTLKKLQARWIGKLPGIEGRPRLIQAENVDAVLAGRLTNATGRDLKHVYLAFTAPAPNGEEWVDWLYYVPAWDKDKDLDLKDVCDLKKSVSIETDVKSAMYAKPGDGKIIRDRIPRRDDAWVKFWSAGLRYNPGDAGRLQSNYDPHYLRSFPLVSLYERLPVMARPKLPNGTRGERFDVQRRGVRRFDMSPAVAAGELVILAHDAANNVDGRTESKLPFPLEVDGDKIPGSGVTFYQFALPLKREIATPPGTQPTTQDVEQ